MAQSVNLWGATYSDVPAIEVPKSGGGMASFTDVTDTTAAASDVATGKYFYTAAGVRTQGTGSGGGGGSVTQDQDGYIVLPSTGGGGGGATQHTIYFEFTDSTDATINAWYDSSFISDAITATEPTTYGQKTVDSASLDGVEWYARPTETWETIYDDNIGFYNDPDNDYPYCWVSSLSDVTIATGSVWRVTYNNVQYRCTAKYDSIIAAVAIGNPKWAKGLDDGSDAPFVFDNPGWGAWTGSLNAPNTTALYHFKIERLVTV